MKDETTNDLIAWGAAIALGYAGLFLGEMMFPGQTLCTGEHRATWATLVLTMIGFAFGLLVVPMIANRVRRYVRRNKAADQE